VRRNIVVLQCSVTDGGTECIVNASNTSAALGSGVSRAISDECGGSVLQAEMREKLVEEFDGVLEEGDCLVTSAGTSSRFKHVLHVSSVDYRGTKAVQGANGVVVTVTSPARIQSCTEAALAAAADLARDRNAPTSITFPLLGAGSGGVAPAAAMRAMLAGLRAYFSADPEAPIERIVFAVPESDRHEICSRLATAALNVG